MPGLPRPALLQAPGRTQTGGRPCVFGRPGGTMPQAPPGAGCCRAASARVLWTPQGERRKAPALSVCPAMVWKGEGRQVFPWWPSRFPWYQYSTVKSPMASDLLSALAFFFGGRVVPQQFLRALVGQQGVQCRVVVVEYAGLAHVYGLGDLLPGLAVYMPHFHHGALHGILGE